MSSYGQTWRKAFQQQLQNHQIADALKQASLNAQLAEWTQLLTAVTVTTCKSVGWQASARGHALDLLPIATSEYLALDVMAFPHHAQRWQFPIAVIELENSPNRDRVAYSLWKVLSIRTPLRIVIGYCKTADDRASLINFLQNEVIQPIQPQEKSHITGETLVVIGSRADAATFPYGFFKWWSLDPNPGTFSLI